MCRNIKKLRRPGKLRPTDTELHDAALQFIRKISGFREPSRLNQDAFYAAVHEVAHSGQKLFASLKVRTARRSAA